uniref:Uncharacterized protein n=1 Tax=Anguilla anguilla TaxID=7936 RepID=A0A0E9RRL4_ANGAN
MSRELSLVTQRLQVQFPGRTLLLYP